MPTILSKHGYRFFFFSNEGNEPPHIHVEGGGGYAKFWLFPVRLAYFRRLTTRQLTKLYNLVFDNQELFKITWFEYFK
ncbi:MAG TPA: DUF4160 domain-containing protein [Saprospiraceae bacterium]